MVGSVTHPWRRTLGALCVLLVAGLFLVPALVEARDPPLDEKARKKRLSKLRSAGGKWITHRKRFPSRCPQCKGAGKITSQKGMRKIRIKCPQCDGNRAWVSRKDYKKIYYDMRSPAFRMAPDIQDRLNDQYRLAKAGKPWPTMIKRYRIRKWEMVGDRHGIVWFLYNASRTPTATYWVWVPKGTHGSKRDEWCVYDSRYDGPWPQDEDELSPSGSSEAASWEAVSPMQGKSLRAAVSAARLTWRAAEYGQRSGTLLVQLKPWADLKDRLPIERVAEDAVRLHHAIYNGSTGWDTAVAEWRVRWRDVNNRIVFKTAWTTKLTRTAFESGGWKEKTAVERLRMLDWEVHSHDGWRLLRGDAEQPASPHFGEPAPAPADDTPTPDEPPVEPAPPDDGGRGVPPPDDDEPAPGVPAPDDDKPAPPPQRPAPPPPQPTPTPTPEPESWELPKPSTKQMRDGKKGIARMLEIFNLAKEVYNEGVEAHRGGAHDVWQEKLAEARAHLNDMEDAWLEEVAGKMPGRDEGEKDAVANEHFGEIWDEVYKLKAMVRKMSAL